MIRSQMFRSWIPGRRLSKIRRPASPPFAASDAIVGAVKSMNAMQAPVAVLFPPKIFSEAK